MFWSSSSRLTTWTSLSVRLTTSGLLGSLGGVCCEKRSAGIKRTAAASTALPASCFPRPAFPLQPFQQRVVAWRCSDALDEPFHRGAGRHLLETASECVDML